MAKSSICIFKQPRMQEFLKFLPPKVWHLITIIKRKEIYGVSRQSKIPYYILYPIILPSVSTRVSSQQCSVLSTTLSAVLAYQWTLFCLLAVFQRNSLKSKSKSLQQYFTLRMILPSYKRKIKHQKLSITGSSIYFTVNSAVNVLKATLGLFQLFLFRGPPYILLYI